MASRPETDSMGTIDVPADALYGAHTARAIANFPISGHGLPRGLIAALGLIKQAAAQVNRELGLVDAALAEAIVAAAREVWQGSLDQHFPVDVFQTGSGTSSNMNANEVIANRAIQLLGGELGSRHPVHPNDHVNLGQSSNDVFPSAIHIATISSIDGDLVPALQQLHEALNAKSRAFDSIVKIGRTHLQDAVPLRLGQEFSAFSAQVAFGLERVSDSRKRLQELALGGTAVGTGLNTHPEFGQRVAAAISDLSGIAFTEAENHFEAQAGRDAIVQCSGTLKTLAVSLLKIANDIRFLASGPRLGLAELTIPALQPGSSIMPGKTNPVVAEALIMVCAQVIGNDAAITLGGLYGNFQLNAMLPLIGRNVLEQVQLLAAGARTFGEKLVQGIEANVARIEQLRERSLSLATALAPALGYDRAAELAKEAARTDRTIREVAREQNVLAAEELDRLLDLRRQTEPGGS